MCGDSKTSLNKANSIVLICYGNILRSQVLEQYLRHYAGLWEIDKDFFSAGVASADEFPDKEILYDEISTELDKREIPHSLNRNPWDSLVEYKASEADVVICADAHVRAEVLKRMCSRIDKNKVLTFYESISEGEVDFEDTYDYENNRQDPIRFAKAFDELDRIARKILVKLKTA